MASKELLVLRLLAEHPRGLYGSEMVNLTEGALGRATIYTLLQRMVDKGFLTEVVDPPTASLSMSRTRHKLTAKGAAEFDRSLNELGLTLVAGRFAHKTVGG